MVTKKKSTAAKKAKNSRVKVSKLKLNKETVKDLTSGEANNVKGGLPIKLTPATCYKSVCGALC